MTSVTGLRQRIVVFVGLVYAGTMDAALDRWLRFKGVNWRE